jgi:beta-galactosidase
MKTKNDHNVENTEFERLLARAQVHPDLGSKHMIRSMMLAALAALGLGGAAVAASATTRAELSLDGPGWHAWLDREAKWQDDALFAPGELPPLDQLPVNPPTGGWDRPEKLGVPCATPACIEQLFANGDVTFRHHGVSWFTRTVQIPADWQGKTVRLQIARARLRIELYVNQKLAGYDLCCETPVAFDLTPYLVPGRENRLAIRLTNPGGSRGFNDCPQVRWGAKRLPSGRDFAGLDTVTLTATDPVHIANLFVMNQLPAGARNLEIRATLRNDTAKAVKRTLRVQVEKVWKAQEVELQPGTTEVVMPMTIPGATLWSPDTPNLYTCEAVLLDASATTGLAPVERGLGVAAGDATSKIVSSTGTSPVADTLSVRFGFRVFEVRADADGKSCFYLNGKRFRHRSAIDFGFYSHTGLFATEEQAQRSVLAAKAIGHNGLNLHRHIGEFRVLDAADTLGLAMYEEPGGLHQWQGHDPIEPGTLADKVIQEKVRRMAVRDRNHPSLLIHNLSNEDNFWGPVREQALRAIHKLNPAVMVCNASGHAGSGTIPGRVTYAHSQPSGPVNHIRPYEDKIRNDYQDDHTVGSTAFFDEFALRSHAKTPGNDLFYFGEVFCHTGPANWWLVTEQQKESPAGSYDLAAFRENHAKIAAAFADWNLATVGSRFIRTPADVSRQAGRTLMYMDGRLSQRIMANNSADGYAINGWSAHSYHASGDTWDSAIVDEGRNLKGPAEDYRIWTRPAQVAIFRKGAKFVKPGDSAEFELRLVNEGIIPAGQYQLNLTVTDGAGARTGFAKTIPVTVKGGDSYAQPLGDLVVPVKPEWRAGHLTLRGELVNTDGKVVADGAEQVLLQNRASFARELTGIRIAVANWPAAEAALKDAGTATTSADSADVILAGSVIPGSAGAPTGAPRVLARAKAGATLILKFDAEWGKLLHEQGILSEPVAQWGGKQTGHWNGNGWGYLDHFVGDQAVPAKTTLGTTGWEVPGDPVGFYPFTSTLKRSAYGLYMARPTNQSNTSFTPYTVPAEKLGGIPEAGLFRACGFALADLALKVPAGDCKVTLRFCETYHAAARKRSFTVKTAGRIVVKNLDIVARAGAPFKPFDLSFDTKVTDGILPIVFEPVKHKPCLSAIVIEGADASGKPWTRKICLGQEAWQDYTAPKAEEWISNGASFAVLLAALDYGKGKIVLAPSYPVDANHAFNDLLFFNLILKSAKREW